MCKQMQILGAVEGGGIVVVTNLFNDLFLTGQKRPLRANVPQLGSSRSRRFLNPCLIYMVTGDIKTKLDSCIFLFLF